MGTPSPANEILTGWKEIAGHLKSSVRSCLRWEAKAGLPAHRPQGAPRSRVFAYKGELDAWLRARLTNGAIETTPRARRDRFRPAIFLLPFMLLTLAAAVIFLVTKGPQEPPMKRVSAGVPESSGPFDLLPGDIVSSQWAAAGTMRVWRKGRGGSVIEAWRIEPVRHTSLTIADLDGKPGLEVVAPGHCREEREVEGRKMMQIRFFLNAYKIDYKDWWRTTYYDPAQGVWEEEDYRFTEIAAGDLDSRPGNEIILATAHHLSVFRYEPLADEIRLIETHASLLEGTRIFFRSIAIDDIDGDGANELLALANQGSEEGETEDKSWLIIMKWQREGLAVSRTYSLRGSAVAHSLKTGNIIPGGDREVVFALHQARENDRRTVLALWRNSDGHFFEKILDEPGQSPGGAVCLAVGDLIPDNSGEEIVVVRHDPNELMVYSWLGGRLSARSRYSIDHRCHVNGLRISDTSPEPARVLLYGASDIKDQVGRTYLELLRFNDGIFPELLQLGGAKGNLPVTWAEFAKAPDR